MDEQMYLVIYDREFIGFADNEHDDIGNAKYTRSNFRFYRLERISSYSIERLKKAVAKDKANRQYEMEGFTWTLMTPKEVYRIMEPDTHLYTVQQPETEERAKKMVDDTFDTWLIRHIEMRHEEKCIAFTRPNRGVSDCSACDPKEWELCHKMKEYKDAQAIINQEISRRHLQEYMERRKVENVKIASEAPDDQVVW